VATNATPSLQLDKRVTVTKRKSPARSRRAVNIASSSELLSLVVKNVKPLPLFARQSSQFEALKNKHKIPDGFDLSFKLRSIYWEARELGICPTKSVDPVRREVITRRGAPSARELKLFVRKVQQRVRSLNALIQGASADELSFLMGGHTIAEKRRSPNSGAATRSLFTVKDLDQLRDVLTRLDHAASEGAKVRFESGKRVDQYSAFVAKQLRQLYIDAFGPKASRLSGTAKKFSTVAGEKYSGRFIDFMGDVLYLFDVHPMSNKALGELCSKAIRAVDGNSRSPKSRRAPGRSRGS